MTHLTNSPEGFCYLRKQAMRWKSALSEQSGMSCSVSWMYMLYPLPKGGTIHGLLPGSFLWLRRCRRETESKASYSSCWLLPPLHTAAFPPNDDREQLLRGCFEFLWDVYFHWHRNTEHKSRLFGRGGSVCSAIPGVMLEKSVSHFQFSLC